jgi:hypothetical protein
VRFGRLFCVIALTVAMEGVSSDTGAASTTNGAPADSGNTFSADVEFLRRHTPIVVLRDARGASVVAVATAWQGRVMTSSAQGSEGRSFGWINRKLIASRQTLSHFNPLGGEDRLWLGPEGGQFSIYFANGAPCDLEHWFVPAAFDTRTFEIVERARDYVNLKASFDLTNYSGTHFDVRVQRTVRLLTRDQAWSALSVPSSGQIALVAYESENSLTNAGRNVWRKETGLLSIWILGMFDPSPAATIVIPIKAGADTDLGTRVTSDYFGPIPEDRLKMTDRAVFLRGDGQYRSKVGVNPKRSLGRLGSYDAVHHVLTIVEFDQREGVTDYVNSLWRLQKDPFSGDTANAYNDGPLAEGVPPMGPFFELESSSPAAALAPGENLSHTHRTLHLTGPEEQLDAVARAVLGVSLAEIKSVFASAAPAGSSGHPNP